MKSRENSPSRARVSWPRLRQLSGLSLLTLLLAASVQAQEAKDSNLLRAAQTVVVSGAIADIISTAGFRHSTNVREGNPLYAKPDGSPHMTRVIAGKSAIAVLSVLAMEQWKKRGHPKIGAAVGFAIGAVDWTIALNNRRLTQGSR